MNNIQRFIEIKKIDEEERMVYGWASTSDLDKDGEVIEAAAFEKSLPEYLRFPTIREMHQPKPIGLTKETRLDKNKGLFIGAKIVDTEAWNKVKEGVYRAFSIGGRVKNRIDNIIKEIELIEISLVDVPANPAAIVTLYKGEKTENVYINEFQQLAVKLRSLMDEKEMVEETKDQEVIEETTNETEKGATIEESSADETGTEATETAETAETESVEKTVEVELETEAEVTKSYKAEIAKFDSVVKELSTKLESLSERLEKLETMPSDPKTKGSFIAVNEVEGQQPNRAEAIDKRLAELMELREKDLQAYQLGNYQVEAMKLLAEKKSL